jgi:hypothetical protein
LATQALRIPHPLRASLACRGSGGGGGGGGGGGSGGGGGGAEEKTADRNASRNGLQTNHTRYQPRLLRTQRSQLKDEFAPKLHSSSSLPRSNGPLYSFGSVVLNL